WTTTLYHPQTICGTQIQLRHSQTSCTATPTEEDYAARELEPSDGTANVPRPNFPKDDLEQGSSSGAPEGLDVPEEEDTVLLAVGLEIQGFQEQGDMFASFRRLHKCICTQSLQFGCVECVSEHYSCSKCLYVCSKCFDKDSLFCGKKSKPNGCRPQPNEAAPLPHVGRGQHRSANSAAGQSPSCTSPYSYSYPGTTESGDETRITSWLHPRSGEPVNSGQMIRSDLPRGWEEGFTDEGASYFIK
ncbi:hypothetical protein XENOCAPTIV_002141, partial [Xenoophorus captivus]